MRSAKGEGDKAKMDTATPRLFADTSQPGHLALIRNSPGHAMQTTQGRTNLYTYRNHEAERAVISSDFVQRESRGKRTVGKQILAPIRGKTKKKTKTREEEAWQNK